MIRWEFGFISDREISLKFVQFLTPDLIFGKSTHHRNHMADFGEKKGVIPFRNLLYASLNVGRLLDKIEKFRDFLGIPHDTLATTIETTEYVDSDSFDKVLRVFGYLLKWAANRIMKRRSC